MSGIVVTVILVGLGYRLQELDSGIRAIIITACILSDLRIYATMIFSRK